MNSTIPPTFDTINTTIGIDITIAYHYNELVDK